MKLLFTTTSVKSNIVGTPSHIFLVVICRRNLAQLFCPQLFAVGLFRVCKQTFFLCDQILFLWWPITATVITKRNTVKSEILINRKVLLSYKRGLLSIKKSLFTEKKKFAHTEKRCFYMHKTNPRQTAAANPHGKKPRQIPTANGHGIFPGQITIANM